MKKLIAILFASVLFFSVPSMAEIGFGVTVNYSEIDTDGSETELTGDLEKTSTSISEDVVIPEVFVEVINDTGWTLGLSYVPARELGSKKRTDTDGSHSAAENDDGDYTAKAEINNLIMLYTDIPIGPVYVKLGVQRAEILTQELLDDTTQYEDAHVNGYTVGLGYRGSLADGAAFYKAEVAYTDFDEYKDTSDSGTATVVAETDVTSARISLGFAF